ncbi:SMALL AUXIN UPREGULATED RNA 47 [Hibiscus trionum]|uniref:SMALL AUXIN UPREGULATED RNA 47 n=1 Tax=Hibiscus trionum TaxID=183268 RepID=A0A9W7IBB2_HIBTR|nr:SMALL AUXIN UPREGULATED RNA 47 [Hibiscus trionum]
MLKKSLLTDRELSDGDNKGSAHVPKGSIAVYVGPELRRYVVPIRYLRMPEFRDLMDEAAKEYGFQNGGGLEIPCDEQYFEYVLIKCATQLNV